MPRRLLHAALIAALLPCSSHAAVVYLKNGDKLSGHIVRHAEGRLVLSHPLLGEIKVPETDILRVQEDAPAPAPAAAAVAAVATPGQAGTASQSPAKKQNGPAVQSTKSSKASNGDDDDDEPRAHTWLRGWTRVVADAKGGLEFGYQNQQGRTNSNNLALRAFLEYTNQPNSYRFDWRYFYGQTNDTVQTDKKDWTFRWRHDLDKRWFTQTITAYASDRIKHIDLNLEQSAGVGYAALNTNRQKFNVGAGVVGQQRVILGQDTGIIALGQFFEDYTRKINRRFSIRQEALVQYSPVHRASYTTLNGQLVASNGNATNYRYTFNAALQGKITEKVTLSLRFDYEFDNTVFEDNLKADRRLSTTIGYSF